jgi:hypothetical protein
VSRKIWQTLVVPNRLGAENAFSGVAPPKRAFFLSDDFQLYIHYFQQDAACPSFFLSFTTVVVIIFCFLWLGL